jgi:hypothetical protein
MAKIADLKEKFIECINGQKLLYEQLKTVILEEQKLLANRNIKGMEQVIRSEENIIVEIKKFEDMKNEIFSGMAVQAGFDGGEKVKLQDVLFKMGPSAAGVEEAVESLMIVVRGIAAVNGSNTHLIKKFLDYVNFSAQLKEKMSNPVSTTYSGLGVVQEQDMKERKSNLDIKL